MNKNIKTVTKILIIILMAIAILLVLPKAENAASKSYNHIHRRGGADWDNGESYEIKWDWANKKWYWYQNGSKIQYTGLTLQGTDMFYNNNIFCMQYLQEIEGGDDWKLSKKIEFNGSTIKINGTAKTLNANQILVAKRIAYILAYDTTQGRYQTNVGWTERDDPKQLALWYYMSKNASNVQYIFGDSGLQCKSPSVSSDKTQLKHEDGSWSKTAMDIYKKADAFNGTGSFVAYLLECTTRSGQQKLLLLESATSEDKKPISFNIYKRDRNNAAINGVTIKVSAVSGCSIEGATDGVLTMKSANNSDKTGYFGKIKINPSAAKGTCKIKITEEQPGSYYKISDTELTIKYGYGELGKIDDITFDKNSDSFKVTRYNSPYVTSINLLNDSRVAKNLNIYKQDMNGNGINGITFQVYFNNVASVTIKGKTYSVSAVIKDNKTVKLSNNKTYYQKIVDGLELLVPTKENVTTDDYKNRLYVRGLKTETIGNVAGRIKIDEVKAINSAKSVIVTVEERNATNNYSKLPEQMKMYLKYNTSEFKWELVERKDNKPEDNKLDPTYWSIDGENLELTLKNDRKISELALLKVDASDSNIKLKDVVFDVTLENVKSIDGHSSASTTGKIVLTGQKTDANGKLSIKNLVVNDINKDIKVTIKETKASTGNGYYYKVIENPITITLTKASDYKTANIVDGSNSSTATVTNNIVNLTVKNQAYINLGGMVWEDGQLGQKAVIEANGIKDSSEKGLSGVLVGLKSNGQIIKTVPTGANGEYLFKDIPKTSAGYQIVFSYDGINWQETKSIRNVTGGSSDATEINRSAFNNRFKTISAGKSNDETVLGYTYNSNDKTSKLNVTMDGSTTGSADAKFRMNAETGIYKITDTNIDCGLVKKEFDLAIGTDVKEATLKINESETKYTYAQIMDGVLNFQNSSSTAPNVEDKYNLYLYTSDYNYRISDYKTGDEAIKNTVNQDDNNRNDYDNLKELEAYVTYSVILKSQTQYYNGTVEQFVYYYDQAYTPQFKVGDVIKGYKVVSIANNMITFENTSAGNKLISPNYRIDIDLTFKVNKDSNGNLIVKENATNIAEIIKYSTDIGGLIDKDSAPGNGIENGVVKQYEDDTDTAYGLDIAIRTGTRVISGTVFEDTDKDGSLNNNNAKVNDVIVQLIEIKKIGGQYFEYIWQETRSGSNQVKTTARNGYQGKSYTNSVQAGSGMYEFRDYIPGNYIIRFIYGDGTTYNLTNNVKKYNGQDYKSTIDANYQKNWYNTAGYVAGQSVARDNEARRLEVMANSIVNSSNGVDLSKTWMAAETSKVNVPIDVNSFANMNFGLTLRTKTKLVLEKHITGLKITPNGTGVQPIVDAKADIKSILAANSVSPTGITTGLATTKSDRANRGFWYVGTDIEELAQGAQLEVEYTYAVRNDSEADYLSSYLVEQYLAGNEQYKTILGTKAAEVKRNTKGQTEKYGNYLGEFYYKGTIGANDSIVPSRVEAIEEAINNDLAFETETSGNDFTKVNTGVVEKNIYNTDGTLRTEQINTVVRTTSPSEYLPISAIDCNKTITLRTVLASTNDGELGANLPSYIAQITAYSDAAGRGSVGTTPGNLSYVHSDDTSKTMANSNEADEFWGESIIISKPTGEDRITPLQIAIITISAIATLGVGIVLIKKIVLKK